MQSVTIGESRDPQSVPTQLVFPNLTITLAKISAQSWFDWYKDFVINGNNGPSNEKGLALKRHINRAYGVGIELYCKQRFKSKKMERFPLRHVYTKTK